MPVLNSNDFGDLYISFKIMYPTELDKSTKSKIWTLLTKSNYVFDQESETKKYNTEIITLEKNNSDPKYKKSETYRQHEQKHARHHQGFSEFQNFEFGGGNMKGGNSFFKMFF